ncbi:MAG: hypothetical protein ACLP19_13065 [Xanthobacteraceae bacterium]
MDFAMRPALYLSVYNVMPATSMKSGPVMVKIRSEKLTTCRVAADGGEVGLELIDASGVAVRLDLPVEQAQSLVMTLPRLLACALQQKTGDEDARYVFGLGEWAIESAKGEACLIATLKTADGFEVCFGIPFEACRSLGWNLLRAAETHDPGEPETACCRMNLN